MHSGFQACLAHYIYRCLNLVFDTARYGTVVRTPAVATPGRRVEFPISCPVRKHVPQLIISKLFFFQTCQVKPGEQPVEISDMTARLVLGEANMDEWNHARFLSMLNLIYWCVVQTNIFRILMSRRLQSAQRVRRDLRRRRRRACPGRRHARTVSAV
jgi:hypothetical protein